MAAKQLILLEANSVISSKRPLKSLNNQTDFDSAVLGLAHAKRWHAPSLA